jgi:hypothetical protein
MAATEMFYVEGSLLRPRHVVPDESVTGSILRFSRPTVFEVETRSASGALRELNELVMSDLRRAVTTLMLIPPAARSTSWSMTRTTSRSAAVGHRW